MGGESRSPVTWEPARGDPAVSLGHLALQQHPPFKHGVETMAWAGLEGDLEREVVAHCSGCPKKCLFSKEFGKKTNRDILCLSLPTFPVLQNAGMDQKKKKKVVKQIRTLGRKAKGSQVFKNYFKSHCE